MKSTMKPSQPVLNLPRTALDNILELVCILGFLTMVYLLVKYYPQLPQRIAIHFGASGLPDGWSDKSSIFGEMVIGLVIYLGLTFLYHYPQMYTYFYKITEANAEVQYRLARSLMSWLKAGSVIIAAYAEWMTIQNALAGADRLSNRFVIIVLVFTFVPIVFYTYKANLER